MSYASLNHTFKALEEVPRKPLSAYSRGELAVVILKGLVGAGFLITAAALPGTALIVSLLQPNSRREREYIKRTVQSMKRQRLIQKRTHGTNDGFVITENGKRRIVKFEFDNLKITPQKRWDGCWRIFIFDIPERKRGIRKTTAQKAQEMGMLPLQKSVFVTPYACEREVAFLQDYLGIQKYSSLITATHIDTAPALKKAFRIE